MRKLPLPLLPLILLKVIHGVLATTDQAVLLVTLISTLLAVAGEVHEPWLTDIFGIAAAVVN